MRRWPGVLLSGLKARNKERIYMRTIFGSTDFDIDLHKAELIYNEALSILDRSTIKGDRADIQARAFSIIDSRFC